MSHKQTAKSFWARVQIRGPDDCWEWQGSRTNSGYGSLSWHGHIVQAHRVAYFLTRGQIGLKTGFRDKGKAASYRRFVLHKCDNNPCCNPRHLFLGSMSANQKDAYKKGRKKQPQGADHINARLSTPLVKRLRLEYATGRWSQDTLAEKYGISQRTVSLAVRRETYRNIT